MLLLFTCVTIEADGDLRWLVLMRNQIRRDVITQRYFIAIYMAAAGYLAAAMM